MAASDSSFVAGTTTGDEGTFVFEQIDPGSYRVQVTMLGYGDYISDVLAVSEDTSSDLGKITLVEETAEMEEVSVEARRELFEQKGDRLVVNVGNSVSLAGQSALEVLKQSPGVIVNEQAGTISMQGKDGVRVMMDGQLSHIPSENIVQFLKGLSAENIESIELITSPPASLEAEGNAGFINIVLKQDPTSGLNGSVSAAGGYGEGEVVNASTELTYRRNRLRIHGSYSFSRNGQLQQVTNYRRIRDGEGLVETSTTTNRDRVQQNHDARVALDYEVNDATSVGAVVGAYDHRWTMDALNRMLVRENDDPSRRVRSENDELNHWRHLMGSVYARRELGVGSVRAQLDYVHYHDNNPTTYYNTSTDLSSGSVTEEQMESRKITPLDIYVGKVDYEANVSDGLQLEAGLKGSFSRFTNEAQYEGLVNREWIDDAGLAPTSHLREDVLAVYGNSTYSPSDPASLQLGLRYELTDSNLRSGEQNDLVDRRFGSLFPSVAYSHELGENRKIDLSYTRRITRPSFRDMAPFLYFIDPRTFFTGNPGLQPALTNTVKLDVTYGDLYTSVQYASEDSSIIGFQNRVIPDENVQLSFPVNYDQIRRATGLVALPIYPTDWWTMQNDAMVTWQEVHGYRDEETITKRHTTLRINSTQNFSLPGEFDLEVSGFYQTAWMSGLQRGEPYGRADFALQRSLPDGMGTLTLSVNDVFDSEKWTYSRELPDDSGYIEQELDMVQRSIQLSYSLRFGGGGESDMPTTASEEEQSRANN